MFFYCSRLADVFSETSNMRIAFLAKQAKSPAITHNLRYVPTKKMFDKREERATPRCVQNDIYYLRNHSFSL